MNNPHTEQNEVDNRIEDEEDRLEIKERHQALLDKIIFRWPLFHAGILTQQNKLAIPKKGESAIPP